MAGRMLPGRMISCVIMRGIMMRCVAGGVMMRIDLGRGVAAVVMAGQFLLLQIAPILGPARDGRHEIDRQHARDASHDPGGRTAGGRMVGGCVVHGVVVGVLRRGNRKERGWRAKARLL